MSELMDEFGPAGYGVWWIIIEKIASQMDETERCFASYSIKKWSNSCRISPTQVQQLVSFLTENGCFSVKKDSNGGGKLTIFCKNILKYRDEYSKKRSKTPDIVRINSGATPDPRARALTDTDTDTDTDTEKHTPLPPAPANPKPKRKKINGVANLTSDQQKSFDEFWQAYPKKEKKKEASESWAALKPDENLSLKIIQAVESAKRLNRNWRKNGGQYIPLPSTWLNGHRWLDDFSGMPETTGNSVADQTIQNCMEWAQERAQQEREREYDES